MRAIYGETRGIPLAKFVASRSAARPSPRCGGASNDWASKKSGERKSVTPSADSIPHHLDGVADRVDRRTSNLVPWDALDRCSLALRSQRPSQFL
jgi:hypothetical protein